MFRNDFPDISNLKHMIAQQESHGWGWPNVVINTKTRLAERPDIKGTLSIFSNIAGSSYCEADGHKVRVEDDMFFISNNKQHYTLQIDEHTPTETLNIHFSTSLLNSFLNDRQFSNELQLDNAGNGRELHIDFHNCLYHKDEQFLRITKALHEKGNANALTDLKTDELLSSLLCHLQNHYHDVRAKVNRIDTAKVTTREEVYARLSVAVDYMYSYYMLDISLEELAAAACMSKFHFLRTFKEVHKQTPHQFLTRVRMQKAAGLLRDNTISIFEIGGLVGYDNASVFSRAFHKYYGMWPQAYRGSISK